MQTSFRAVGQTHKEWQKYEKPENKRQTYDLWCKDHIHISAWIKNKSESDPHSYAVTNKAQKKMPRLQQDSNPWPPQYQCNALPTELWFSLVGSRSSASSIYTCYIKRMTWCVYEKDHMSALRMNRSTHAWLPYICLLLSGFSNVYHSLCELAYSSKTWLYY